MRHSTDRILVSHAGNLPRPADLQALIDAHDAEGFRKRLPSAVDEIALRQIWQGVDVVNDGEYVKAGSFGGYIYDRLSGIELRPADPLRAPRNSGVGARDRKEFPGFYESGLWNAGSGGPVRPGRMPISRRARDESTPIRVCTGPVRYTGQAAITADAENLNAAILNAAMKAKKVEGFLAAIGPRNVANAYNDYYRTDEELLYAAADALHEEYKAITDAGLIVQIDEPTLATTWQFFPDMTVEEYRRVTAQGIEAINHALRGIPEDQVRLHFCWGSGHRPHVFDSELRTFADIVVKVKARSITFEAANVRHEHEWQVWRDVKIPDGMILMPGVIAHATDVVEHPELVAERLARYAGVVGRENVQASTDCGIGSRVGHEEIVWDKLKTMSEGARIASQELWGRHG